VLDNGAALMLTCYVATMARWNLGGHLVSPEGEEVPLSWHWQLEVNTWKVLRVEPIQLR